MKKTITTVIILLFSIISFAQKGSYVLRLSKVEVGNSEVGLIHIDSIKPSKIMLYKSNYTDSLISVTFEEGLSSIPFELTNKSNNTLKIIWNDAAYINPKSNTGKIMHTGVKYIDRNNDQPSTSIIKGAKITDQATPTENIYYSSGTNGGWSELNLLPHIGKGDEKTLIGKTVKLLLPIQSGAKQHDYVFTFDIIFNEYKK